MELTERQKEYKRLVEDDVYFEVKGHSLIAYGNPYFTYPVRMALHIDVYPKNINPSYLQKLN